MFHEVLVISYIKICKFSAVISQKYLGILLECSFAPFGLGSSRNEHKSSSQRNNTHKSFSNCSGSSPKKYTVIHKTLISAAFSRRFEFVSVRRPFVICDLKLLRERQIYRSFVLREIFIKPLVYVAVESVLSKTLSSFAQNFKYKYFCCLCGNVSRN